jgi:hypothetical protein
MAVTYKPPAYADRLRRGEAEHGEKWDPSSLDACPTLWRHYRGDRVRVRFEHGEEMTGRITTTGWRPAFLLVRRSSDHGSPWLLGPKDRVVAVWDGRRYVPNAHPELVGA